MDKAAIRKEIKGRKALASDLPQQSAALMEALERHPRFLSARTVLMYWSLPDEPCTHAFIEKWGACKEILLPVVSGEDLRLGKFVSRKSLSEGAWGIMEPLQNPSVELSRISLVVVPGVAFDARGNRLGRGKGYYDRFLSWPELGGAYKLGLCFDFQMLDSLPASPWDVPMDEVLRAANLP